MTSPIYLTVIEPHSGRVLNRRSVPTSQVVTSFSSKSELALHLGHNEHGNQLVFVGYGSAGVGALDVSNSDAVPGQDPTNPVSFAFGRDYAFPRTIVSMDDDGHLTPDNGRGDRQCVAHRRECRAAGHCHPEWFPDRLRPRLTGRRHERWCCAILPVWTTRTAP